MSRRRTDRVGDLIRAELASIFQRDLGDPRVRLATVSSVEVTANLAHARVMVSVLGTEDERGECLRGLTRARGYCRRLLAARLRLKAVPELDFVLDRGAEHSIRIAEILESLRHDDDEQSA